MLSTKAYRHAEDVSDLLALALVCSDSSQWRNFLCLLLILVFYFQFYVLTLCSKLSALAVFISVMKFPQRLFLVDFAATEDSVFMVLTEVANFTASFSLLF